MNEVVERPATEVTGPEQQKKAKTALMQMATRYGASQANLMKTLKATVFSQGANKPEITDEQFTALVIVANEYRLNPLTKEIYAFPDKGGGVVPVVSIDGWLRIINEDPAFDGLEVVMNKDDKGNLESATCTIYRKDRNRPTVVTEYLAECKRGTEPWKQWPNRMLRHKAIIQCARVAFSFGGIHDQDEATDIVDGAQMVREVDPVIDEMNRDIQSLKEIEGPAAGAPQEAAATVQESDETVQDQSESVHESAESDQGPVTFARVFDQMKDAQTLDELVDATALLSKVADKKQRDELDMFSRKRRKEIADAAADEQPKAA